jgi:transposase-like protein
MTTFSEKYAPKYDKAVDCLLKDRDALLTFFDFPAEHMWTASLASYFFALNKCPAFRCGACVRWP